MTINRIYIPADSAEDWRKLLAQPGTQWETGYSAKALAYSWHEANGFPAEIAKALATDDDFADIEPLLILPEHKVPLPGGRRASQNDAWVLARTGEGLVSIAVEGKVSETFGTTVEEWLQDASPGKKERLEFLVKTLGLQAAPPLDILYQLLHRAASAVIEARRFGARHAAMLVHSFR